MNRIFVPLLIALTAFHLVIAWLLPPSEDELYYWCWSQNLQWSYFDHPPMVALMIRLSTEIFGNTLFAIRFPACLGSLVTLLIVRDFTRDDRLMTLALLTPLVLFGTVLMTPDAPLVVFWAAYVWWLASAHERLANDQTPRWILGGVIFGLGVLSKYPMALAAPAAVMSFVVLPKGRRFSVALGLFGHFLVSAFVASPILIHNIRHDFAPLQFQWNHASEKGSALFTHFPDFLAGQVGLIGTGPFLLLGWAVYRIRQLPSSPQVWASAWMFALPMAVFIMKGITGRLEANWPVFCYISCGPLAVEMMRQSANPIRLRRWMTASFAIPTLVSVALGCYMALPYEFVSPAKDRFARLYAFANTNRTIGDRFRELVARGEANPNAPIYAMRYQATAMLRFEGLDARQYPVGTRPSHFTQEDDHPSRHDNMYVVSDGGPLPASLVQGFEKPVELGDFPLVVRDRELARYKLMLYRKTNTDVAVAKR
ncbi:glycosyltransferase family 39 protein [Zavarzinella formosa]|uniref:glycosyltransferase family 39 protein n=1 Tax=Zavarzinella formosa TaxID=360055 RepID=UPI0002E31384|nr:glycosyltransferase family 39 protein [Zavarzinella formosa]